MAANFLDLCLLHAIDEFTDEDSENVLLWTWFQRQQPSLHLRISTFGSSSVVGAIDDARFQEQLRLSRRLFDKLLELLRPWITKDFRGGHKPLEPEVQLLIFLVYLNSTYCLRKVAVQFGVSKSTVFTVVHRLSKALKTHFTNQFIIWPDAERRQQIAAAVENLSGFPGVVGFLDGSHIRLVSKLDQDDDYINRKGYPSIHLQLVVDHEMIITNFYTGWPGSTHDAMVLQNSVLFQEAEMGQLFSPGQFVLADSAYPLRDWLITSFEQNESLTPKQQRFNQRVLEQRRVVDRTIRHLKGRFQRLKEISFDDVEDVANLISATCILHNMCIFFAEDINKCMDDKPPLRPNRCQNVYLNSRCGVHRRRHLMNLV